MYPQVPLTLCIALFGLTSPGNSAHGAKLQTPSDLRELELSIHIEEKSQSLRAEILLQLQQRISASGENTVSPIIQSLISIGDDEFRCLVRPTVVPRLLTYALALPKMFGVARILKDHPEESPPPLPPEGSLSALRVGGGWVELGPLGPLDERHVHQIVPSLDVKGRTCLLIRLLPTARIPLLRTRSILRGRPLALVVGGLAMPLKDEDLHPDTYEFRFLVRTEIDRAGALVGLVGLGGVPQVIPMKITAATDRAVEIETRDQAPGQIRANQVGSPAANMLTSQSEVFPPLVRALILEDIAKGSGRIPRKLARDLINGKDPGMSAAPLRLETAVVTTDLLLSLLRDKRPIVLDAALEKILTDEKEAARSKRAKKSKSGAGGDWLEILEGGDSLAWAAPILARTGTDRAVPALERYVRDKSHEFSLRRSTIMSLLRLAPRSKVIQSIYENSDSPLWPSVIIGLGESSGKVPTAKLVEIVKNDQVSEDERLHAAVIVFRRDSSKGSSLLNWLAHRKNAWLVSEAKELLGQLQ